MFSFTLVDGVFIGRGVNADALGAINIALPFILAILAFDMFVTIGGVTIAAIRLGRGDTAGANQAFMHSLLLMALGSAALCLIGVCFTSQLARFLGANDLYFDYVSSYLFWYAAFLPPAQICAALQGFCRNDGSPRLVAISVGASAAVNVLLDWLFIFPLQQGVAGAAIATGISQIVALLIVLPHFVRKKGVLSFQTFSPSFAMCRKIALRGLPEMIAQFSMPITTFCMNYALLSTLGKDAINAFSIVNYAAAFAVMLFFGTSEGLQPLFGRSYGAKNESDLTYYFRAGILISLVGSALVFAALVLFSGNIADLFGANAKTREIVISAAPKFSWCFIAFSLSVAISAYLYSTKRTKEALIINLCKTSLFSPVIITALPVLFGAGVVWFGAGIAESLTLIVAFTLLKRSEKGKAGFR
jgi:putative MATE family efflux protein